MDTLVFQSYEYSTTTYGGGQVIKIKKNKLNSAVAHPSGLEPETLALEVRCSIHLSYGRINIIIKRNMLRPAII